MSIIIVTYDAGLECFWWRIIIIVIRRWWHFWRPLKFKFNFRPILEKGCYLSWPMVTKSLLKYWDMSSLMKYISSWSMSWAWIQRILPTLAVQLQLSREKSHMYWLPRLLTSSAESDIEMVWDQNKTHRKFGYAHHLHQCNPGESRICPETLSSTFCLHTWLIFIQNYANGEERIK